MSNTVYKRFIEEIPKLYQTSIKANDFENRVYFFLNMVFEASSMYIFYINDINYVLKFSYNSELTIKNISKKNFSHIFSKENYLISDLFIENIPFAKLIIKTTKSRQKESYQTFQAASTLVANILKDIELAEILNMQVQALQEGLKETNIAYKTIKEQNKKIISAEKVKNEFLSNVSHQLRSPLNSIIGFSDMLSQNFIGELNNTQKEYLNSIKISSIKLLEMVNEILDISKIDAKAMKFCPRNFSPYLNTEEVLNILQPIYIEKNLTVLNEIPRDLILTSDYQKFQQIIFNLVSNAIKYTQNAGEIAIKANKSNKNISISVKDNGIGIKKEHQKIIFKKFVQLDSQVPSSTGLGLTIVKELTKICNGNIKVKSEQGKGTEFILSFPLQISTKQ